MLCYNIDEMRNNKVSELKRKLKKKNKIIDSQIKAKVTREPLELYNYIFFNGKQVQKIDSFPDDTETEFIYKDFMLNLEFWHNEMLISFLRTVFAGYRYGIDDIMKFSDYTCPPSDEELKVCLEQIKGLVFNGDECHLIGEPVKGNAKLVSWFFLRKFITDHAKDSISYHEIAQIKNFGVPFVLKPFVKFDGKNIVKRKIFPRFLDEKYDTYICSLKTLFFLYEWDYWETMFGFRNVSTNC